MLYSIREFLSTKKEEKNAEWGNRIIRFIRMNWVPLVSQSEAEYGMSYLLNQQDMTFIENLFQNTTRINLTNENPANGRSLFNQMGQVINPTSKSDKYLLKEMRSVNFKPLPIWEKLRNILVAEMKKMGPVVNVRSEDPTSVSRRVQDKERLTYKKQIEGLLSYVYTSIGQAPYKMKDHQVRFDEKLDNGNTDKFEAMGFTNDDPTDVEFFMNEFHKLDEEIAVQSIIDFISSYNQWDLDIEKWVNDLLAKKALAATVYVDNVTGEITTKYLAPESVYIYGGGNRQDFNDANAKGYERKVTVKEMLQIVGESFNMEREFNNLLQAITYTSQIEFTGVAPSYRGFMSGSERLGGRSGLNYSYNDFLSFKVALGRIEFSTQNQETFGSVEKNDDGGFYENNQPAEGKYPSKARWETPMYKAFYLVISQIDQIMFDFGPIEFQDIMGVNDFCVAGTIITYKDIGDSLAVQSAQIIDMVNEAWYKFRYELRRAKPRGRGWNYDSMVSTLMDMIPDTNTSNFNKLEKVMEMLDSSSNEVYTFPKDSAGRDVQIPGNQLNYDIPNGMNKESMLWWDIMINGMQMLSDMMGIAPLRQGDPGNARDSMNNQFKALEYSQSATYYIPDMLTYLFQQMSVKSNFYVQDIIGYKKYNSLAYKCLEDAVGEDTLYRIEKLGKTGMHRYGIFVESLNQAPLRQKLEPILFEAVKNGQIKPAEYLLISDIKSVKLAFRTFAYFEQRNSKIAQKNAMEQQQQQQQAAIQLKQIEFQTEKMKVDADMAKANIQANANIQAHLINQQGGIAKTEMKTNADRENIYHQVNADFATQQRMLNEVGKTTAPIPVMAPQIQQAPLAAQGSSMPVDDATVSEQWRNRTEPMPTGA